MISTYRSESIKNIIISAGMIIDGASGPARKDIIIEGYVMQYRKDCLIKDFPLILKTPGKAWHAPGRYGRLIGRTPETGKRLGQSILANSHDIDHVKIINAGFNSLVSYGKETLPQFGLKELKDAVDVADSPGLKVMIHANGKVPVQIAVESGCHSIEHGYFMGDDNLRRIADERVTLDSQSFSNGCLCTIVPKG